MINSGIIGGRRQVQFTAERVNFVFDGHSLVAGDGVTGGQTLTVQLAALPPISGQFVIANFGVNGQQITDMISSAGDIDAAWVEGKTNFLGFWGATNTLNFATTVATACAQVAQYISARQALHPWKVILVTELPRRNQGATQEQTDALNAKLNEYNAYIRANFKAMGAVAVVDVRQAGGPWDMPNYTTETFTDSVRAPYWAAEGLKNVHINNAGHALVAGWASKQLRMLALD